MKIKVILTIIVFIVLGTTSCTQNISRSRDSKLASVNEFVQNNEEEMIATCDQPRMAKDIIEDYIPTAVNVEQVAGNEQQEISKDSVHVLVDRRPEFKGGDKNLFSFLSANNLTREKTDNRVILSTFIVEIDGSLTDVRILRGGVVEGGNLMRFTEEIDIISSVEEEAIRFILSMPKWTPAQRNGMTVRARFYLPIPFHLE